MILTTAQQEIVREYNINTNLTEEQLSNENFKSRWTSYLLSIQYDITASEIPNKVTKETAELIFG